MTDLSVEDAIRQQTVAEPVTLGLTERQQNIGKIILPKLLELYRGWERDFEAAKRRDHHNDPFPHWVSGQPVCALFPGDPDVRYNPRFAYASIALSRKYYIKEYEITLKIRGGFLAVDTARSN